MKIGKYDFHFHKINERKTSRGHLQYLFYMRYFLHVYKLLEGGERSVWDGHTEVYIKRPRFLAGSYFSSRFHIGNAGSETPWDGHLVILGVACYWGHSGFRRLAERLTRCSGYKYDSREWSLRIFDHTLWWELANHSDMCDLHRPRFRKKRNGKRGRYRTWRRGSLNLSIPQMIWGPVRYTYETVDSVATVIKLPDGEYPILVDLRKAYVGRTRVDRSKHVESWELEIDAPSGIPTHVDHSGGWKGDRTFGWGIRVDGLDPEIWKELVDRIVINWIEVERKRTGFVKPDPVEKD